MVAKKPKIVIIGAGMAGLTAANKLYNTSKDNMFELCVVEGGNRIGGRINTSEFGGDRIEMGATWIHGIGGSPVYKIAQETNSLCSQQPWECMDGFLDAAYTRAEGGYELNPCLVHSISTLFKYLMDFAQGKLIQPSNDAAVDFEFFKNLAIKASNLANLQAKNPSIGSFLRHGLNAYWESQCFNDEEEKKICGNWSRKLLEEAIFAMHENIQRTYTSAGDLLTLDFNAESEYEMFPGEEITIAKGYISVIESLASVLPKGLIQLGRKVSKIEWQPAQTQEESMGNGYANGGYKPVKLHFCDGSVMCADHVLVTVSLGVLKAGISPDSGKEALELEALSDEEIIDGVSTTISSFSQYSDWDQLCNDSDGSSNGNKEIKFSKVMKSKWGNDPLFLGSYSYVAVGSSGDDMDKLAEPLPNFESSDGSSSSSSTSPPLQILFAGEATHRTHYSTTHGAYLSGLREANRLLQHYNCIGF